MRKIFKWIIGILLLVGLGGGAYLVYRHWNKNHSTKQNNQQIKDFEKVIQQLKKDTEHNKIYLAKCLNNTLKEGEGSYKRDEPPKIPNWEQKNEKTEKLEKEFQQAWKEFSDIKNQIGEYWRVIHKEIADDEKLHKIQKNWVEITFKLDQDREVNARFNDFIKTFFYRFLTKKGLSRSEVDFKGFGNFYIEPKGNSRISEMGNCGLPENEGITTLGDKITRLPIIIKLNQLYLLNNGKNGSMDRFVSKISRNSKGEVIGRDILPIGFNELIETIAHELAHAVQEVKNIDHYEMGKGGIILTQCESSGEGERNDPTDPLKLTKPKYPEWVKDHAQLTEEIHQIIINSKEYKEFERWWKSS
ncbi:hypothetical protein [endosymbiont GvMRE of Glomus versiforme]|uniref:hypothetical protein n=1 Tax=endosymbiont GvMRE of Glomus versiforme TaxID=2039283 RepID=UPI000EC83606|nr:hypothetical protein [endosymbiont GvMRE of Glomus versiforme]RHZ37316.1 hypothetical protein GvMRE_I1g80 [endosymbiont GvMRE of Glomus versiforme]